VIISVTFFVSLITIVASYWLIPRQDLRNLFISLASVVFVAFYDRWAAVVVVTLTGYTYACAWLIEMRARKSFFHKLGVIGVVLTLVVFKYLGLLSSTINTLAQCFVNFPVISFELLLLPLGISYITFKYISYITDVYWRIVGRGRFVDLLCYGSLFTIFVAGPIERFERFKPQIEGPCIPFEFDHIEVGFERIVMGLFKKLVIADWIGYFINPIWEKHPPLESGVFALALLGYSVQIYMDFAGYSDIAIGASRLLGLRICENFNYPYFRQNISQFWQNWHISLSQWIRDYLFFPLSKLSTNKAYLLVGVPLTAMALCGLWHGASWHFVVWGCWHGAGIALLQFWTAYKRKRIWAASLSTKRWFSILSMVATFGFVTLGWIWFR
jgi:alginate O-acetyltransferase complex protein AlgI